MGLAKTTLLAAVVMAATAMTAHAAVIHDPFLSGDTPANGEYADDTLLGAANPTVTGFSGAWSDPTERLASTDAGLTYNLPGQLAELGTGGSLIRRTGGGTGNQSYSRTVSGASSTDPGEAWFAFLLKADSVAAGEQIIASFDFDPDTGGVGAISVGFNGNQFSVESSLSNTVTADVTNLIIGRLTVVQTGGSGNGDELLDIWINPTDASSVAQLDATRQFFVEADGNHVFGTWGASGISIAVAGATGSGNQIDEIMFADTLAEINSAFTNVIPEPASLTLLALGALALTRRRRA